jgi:hypothetical protein
MFANALKITAIVSVVLFAGAAVYAEDSATTEKKDIPEQVLASFNKAYPDAEIAAVEKEEINGATYYEVEIKGDKAERDIIYLADGTLYSIEEEIPVADLPGTVTDALTKAYPKCQIDEAEKITRGSETEFEVVVEVTEGETETEYEIIVASNGNISDRIQLQDDEDDDEDDEEDDEDENEDDGASDDDEEDEE